MRPQYVSMQTIISWLLYRLRRFNITRVGVMRETKGSEPFLVFVDMSYDITEVFKAVDEYGGYYQALNSKGEDATEGIIAFIFYRSLTKYPSHLAIKGTSSNGITPKVGVDALRGNPTSVLAFTETYIGRAGLEAPQDEDIKKMLEYEYNQNKKKISTLQRKDALFTEDEVSMLTGLSRSTIFNAERDGIFPAIRTRLEGSRARKFYPYDQVAYLVLATQGYKHSIKEIFRRYSHLRQTKLLTPRDHNFIRWKIVEILPEGVPKFSNNKRV